MQTSFQGDAPGQCVELSLGLFSSLGTVGGPPSQTSQQPGYSPRKREALNRQGPHLERGSLEVQGGHWGEPQFNRTLSSPQRDTQAQTAEDEGEQ